MPTSPLEGYFAAAFSAAIAFFLQQQPSALEGCFATALSAAIAESGSFLMLYGNLTNVTSIKET